MSNERCVESFRERYISLGGSVKFIHTSWKIRSTGFLRWYRSNFRLDRWKIVLMIAVRVSFNCSFRVLRRSGVLVWIRWWLVLVKWVCQFCFQLIGCFFVVKYCWSCFGKNNMLVYSCAKCNLIIWWKKCRWNSWLSFFFAFILYSHNMFSL